MKMLSIYCRESVIMKLNYVFVDLFLKASLSMCLDVNGKNKLSKRKKAMKLYHMQGSKHGEACTAK